jgi:diguanylate cyclase (GGDEF)-like protein
LKVLIIDDSRLALAVAKERLATEDVEIVCAGTGGAGLEAAAREKPDLVLLDINMPDMLGFDVCRALKADPDLSLIPVIFLSGEDKCEDKVKGLDLGAVDYVTKPFDAFELRARVRAALRMKHYQDMLVRHGLVDALTELSNRRALMDRLEQEWSRMQRHGGVLSLIMTDIDHFKQVNDRHGHPAGDRVLRAVAKVLANHCRRPDTPGRYGGEEFAVVCPDADAQGAAILAERYRRQIEETHVPVDEGEVRVTASFGVGDSTSAASREELIKTADDALYRAKESGRNRVVIGGGTQQTP